MAKRKDIELEFSYNANSENWGLIWDLILEDFDEGAIIKSKQNNDGKSQTG